jgi:hypothetical protein
VACALSGWWSRAPYARVLAPQHASPAGVAALNRALQTRPNPPALSTAEVGVRHELVFRLGDDQLLHSISEAESQDC